MKKMQIQLHSSHNSFSLILWHFTLTEQPYLHRDLVSGHDLATTAIC